jgi:hypothetical protein
LSRIEREQVVERQLNLDLDDDLGRRFEWPVGE